MSSMKKAALFKRVKSVLWWFGCFLAAVFSFQIILVSALILRLAFAPINVTGLGHRLLGTFYLNTKGDLTPIKHNAIGKEAWEKLRIQWMMPSFKDWLFHRNMGGIFFSLSGIKLVDFQGNVIDHIDRFEGNVSIALFSKGKIAINSARLEGADLHLKRFKSGHVHLDFPGIRPSLKPSKPIDLSFLNFDFFSSLYVKNVKAVLKSEDSSEDFSLSIPSIFVHNPSETRDVTKWEGEFGIFAQENGKNISLLGKTEKQRDREDLWRMVLDAPSPEAFENLIPILGKVHLPLRSEITGDPVICALGLKGCSLDFNLKVGKGFYIQPDETRMLASNAFGEGHLDLKENYKNLQVKVNRLNLDLIDSFGALTKVSLYAGLDLDNLMALKETKLQIGGKIPKFNMASLPILWPVGISKNARAWIIENLTEGHARDFKLDVDLEGHEGFDHLKVKNISGDLKAEKVTVQWLKGMPVFKGVGVQAKFVDSDNVLVTMTGGVIDENPKQLIHQSKGSIAITGVTSPKPIAGTIKLGLSGSAPKLIEILSRDRLPILKRLKKYYSKPQGQFQGQAKISLPFISSVKAEEVIFDTEVKTKNLAAILRTVGPVTDLNGTLHAWNKDVVLHANAKVRDIPVKVYLYHNLQADKPGQKNIEAILTSKVNQDFLRKIGIPMSAERLTGAGLLKANFEEMWSGTDQSQIDMNMSLDLRESIIHSLLWNKAKNVSAGGSLHARWINGDLDSLTDLKAYGPEIEIQAQSILQDSEITGLDVKHLKIGKNEGSFRFEWPEAKRKWPVIKEDGSLDTEPSEALSEVSTSKKTERPIKHREKYQLDVHASRIDLEPFLNHTSRGVEYTLNGKKLSEEIKPVMKQENGRTILPAGHWHINFNVQEALLGNGRVLGPFSISAYWNKRHLSKADIEISKPYKAFFKISHDPKNDSEHLFEGEAEHLGEWLSWGKIYPHLRGGNLKLSGKFAPSILLASVSDPLIITVGNNQRHPAKEKALEEALKAVKKEEEKSSDLSEASVHTEGFGLGLPPYAGKISIDKMDWDASLLSVSLAKIITPTYWNKVNGNLHNISMKGAISVQDGIIGFGNIQGKSDIVAATMVGNINLKKKAINLGGTISPDYYWNSSLGHLPSVLGYIFSPEKGSGVLAMGYTLDGTLSAPHFNLNPYMMLLPGILRKIADPNS
ncbi:hypothetical protein FAI40_08740 [Acetobacteraceae bacterium]|nr:hypothetical protein FAI40_08740 [Acetobacteraceae bacterium]